MDWYRDKKIVITGGSSGIGKAAALLLARHGAEVCIIGRTREKLDSALRDISSRASGRKLNAVQADVTDRNQLAAAAPSIVETLGGIDILINCAGITHPSYFDKIPDAVWDNMIRVDYMGTVNAVRAFLPWFMKQRRGHIANVSSVAGYMGVFGYAAYAAAKFAVVGFSECLRQDLLPYNINVSVIYPPDTDTPQWHEENKIKPPETKALSGTIKVLSPEKVASALLKGIAQRRFSIVPGLMNRVTYFMNRHFPGIVWNIVSGDLRRYWRKQVSDAR
ncbi:MAG: SDR family oxidoreductase [Chitinispirillaceae bacterium]|nr:SDR family oxidoreductase [Chitinispirillaceae bacterium]